MRAVTRREWGGPLVVENVDAPQPATGEVLVTVAAAGIDAGVHHLWRGEPGMLRLGMGRERPRDPRIGTELAGTVAALGDGVTAYAVGDRVFGVANGSFAESVVAKTGKLALLPAAIDFADAAAVAVSGITAQDAIDAAGALDGRRVLVTGAGGGVGSLVVQLAVAAGATVTGVCSTAKADMVRQLGASTVVDYTAGEPTGDYDVVVDTGGRRELRAISALLVRGGRAVLVGGEGGGGLLGGFERQLLAPLTQLGSGRRFANVMSSTTTAKLERLAARLVAGEAHAVVDRSYPLEQAAEAMGRFAGGTVAGKLVLLP